MQALWNGTILADSNSTIVVEGNHYFPPESLKGEHFREAAQTTVCGWKGTANYYDLLVGDLVNEGAAWVYREPKESAKEIAGYVAFWKGVEVTGDAASSGTDLTGGVCEI